MRAALALGSLALAVALAVPAGGCAWLAIATAPSKRASHDDSAAAKEAEATFWGTLHGGHYDQIGEALDKLEGVYLAHPEDPRTAAHIGFLHVWRVSERARLDVVRPTVTDDVMLARRYFEESVELDPKDARIRGFWGSAMLAEGAIHHDEKLTRQGFFALGDSVDAWPEFNLFTRGYSMSRLPFDSPRYADAVADQWKTLDLCANSERVDRKTGHFQPFMKLETHVGWKRACWNSWIAPHNFEGFFLNMGDMIVKAGDATLARSVYAQAKLGKTYTAWPYRDVLDRRMAQADENVALFRAPPSTSTRADPERRAMIETRFSCTGCHEE